MSAAGTYARVPMGEAFDVMCNELDDIVNRMCGIEQVALAYAWMSRHSWKVPEAGSGGAGNAGRVVTGDTRPDGIKVEAVPGLPPLPNEPPADRLGDGVAVGQAAGSSSAPTKRELERAALSPSLVGEPPSPTGRENPEASLGTGESRKHSGGSPTRHLAAVSGSGRYEGLNPSAPVISDRLGGALAEGEELGSGTGVATPAGDQVPPPSASATEEAAS